MRSKERVRYWRDPDVDALEIRLSADSTHSFPHHTHDCYTIGVMERGRCLALGPGHGSVTITQGEMCLFNPGQVHAGILMDRDSRITYRMYFVDNAWLRSMAADLRDGNDGLPEFRDIIVHTPHLSRRLMLLNRAVHSGLDRLAKESAMLEAMSGLFFAHGGIRRPDTGSEPWAVHQAKEFLGENLAEKVTLDRLASVTGLSRYHFLRVFKKATGLPPHRYHLQCRVERAKGMLLSGMSIAEAALESGFTDQSHFTHRFKQFTGATPAQYIS
ncbi:AraC family transcriptional regulator [Salidesulfovibrio onnuriiensis]|uniref:AraC family transcriptional regulator n=1 Tax=Salidesulfovibrio onnuriiensis TaxID=2583823 RepID=UPI00164EDB82|nr:AraC family transcriptional regulator [Salidesulfovibrio onnuriiensis]